MAKANTKYTKPLLKWTGGKSNEFKHFKQYIPSFQRYFEPFVGGGGVFFALFPKHAFINDKSTDLISFYRLIGSNEFETELYQYNANWQNIAIMVKNCGATLFSIYNSYKNQQIDKEEMKSCISHLINQMVTSEKYPQLLAPEFILSKDGVKSEIIKNLHSKFSRIFAIEQKEQKIFNEAELKNHIETAFRSGFYMHFRRIMNENKTPEQSRISEPKRIANWFMVRELCYASMFRFNKNGDFNIPYGGIAYNRKNLYEKVYRIFKPEIEWLMKRTSIFNLDFEKFMNKFSLTSNDFVFLDPPYDSKFSEYDQNSFSKDDQKRLAETLYHCKAKWMLVIKNTDFIHSLYADKDNIAIKAFDKKYLYNVRGRNDRKTEHLIITNYPTD